MELSDEIEISVPMQTVYDALNNVDILKKCIPGCEELVKISEDQLEAKVVLKVGPVKARFSGQVTLDASAGPETFLFQVKEMVVPLDLPKVGYYRILLMQKLEANWLNCSRPALLKLSLKKLQMSRII